MENGFILDEARKKMKAGMAYCVCDAAVLVIYSIIIFPLFFLTRGAYEAGLIFLPFLMMYLLIIFINTNNIMYVSRTVRKNYNALLYISDNKGKSDYEDICLNAASGTAFGVFYCSDDLLYSPFGILCKWEDIWKIEVKLIRCKGIKYPYRAIEIRIILNSSEVLEGTVIPRKDIIALARSLDSFKKYVKGRGTAITEETVYNQVFLGESQ